MMIAAVLGIFVVIGSGHITEFQQIKPKIFSNEGGDPMAECRAYAKSVAELNMRFGVDDVRVICIYP